MRTINLLPKTQQQAIKFELASLLLRKFWLIVIVSLLVLLSVSIGSEIFLRSSITKVEDEIRQKQETLAASDTSQVEAQVVNLNQQIQAINNLRAQHYYWSDALIELGNIISSDTVVDLLTLDRATGKVEISGVAGSRESVLLFWQNIHQSAYFKDINFPLANLEKASDTPFSYAFYVKAEELQQHE